MMRLERIWHPIDAWEEMQSPMWHGDSCDLQTAIDFTGDHVAYGTAMARVIIEWPVSCENSLTNYRINRKAWIGHAAAALQIGSSEKNTREAWGYLNDSQRELANGEAARYIAQWERNFAKDRGLYPDMGEQMLLPWNTGRSAARDNQTRLSA